MRYEIYLRPVAFGRVAAEVSPWVAGRENWLFACVAECPEAALRQAKAWIAGRRPRDIRDMYKNCHGSNGNGVPCRP